MDAINFMKWRGSYSLLNMPLFTTSLVYMARKGSQSKSNPEHDQKIGLGVFQPPLDLAKVMDFANLANLSIARIIWLMYSFKCILKPIFSCFIIL